MPKDTINAPLNPPEWSARILRLLDELKLTQAGLARRLGVSAATVSRWVQGKHEPTSEGYVLLGNLGGGPERAYFWERAGVDFERVAGSGDKAASSGLLGPEYIREFPAGKPPSLQATLEAVAIPLLGVTACGDSAPPQHNVRLSEASVEEKLLAPLRWCPHPEQMIAMHLAGESMRPLILPKSILFVDTAVTDREELDRKIVVFSHRDLGFKAGRFRRVAGADLLISALHSYEPIDVTNAAKWKAFGEVLWWISRDEN